MEIHDNGTFWTSDITVSYGIEFYPIHGGHFLGKIRIMSEYGMIESNTEILDPNSDNPNLWYTHF